MNEEDFRMTDKFKIAPKYLANLVKLNDKRDFCEEIDEIEKMYIASSYF